MVPQRSWCHGDPGTYLGGHAGIGESTGSPQPPLRASLMHKIAPVGNQSVYSQSE